MRGPAVGAALCLLIGCGGDKAPEQAAAAAPPVATPVPAQIPLADFRFLSYLHGDWRGKMANGSSFYERYKVVDDSTIHSYTITDSTFSPPTDSSAIRWSNGQVRSGSSRSSYVATIWTADSVRFEPETNANNAFTWIRKDSEEWTARLEPRGGGSPVVYVLNRVTHRETP